MALYYTRHDAMAQAVNTFAPVETDSEGATAGPIAIPPGVSRIKSLIVSQVTDGAHVTDTGLVSVLRLSGTGALPNGTQDLVLFTGHLNDGGGTLTYTASQIVPPLQIPVDIPVNSGADLSLLACYYGTDTGTAQLSVTVEFE